MTSITLSSRDLLRSRTTQGQRRFLKFLVVGASGVPVNLGCVALIVSLLPTVNTSTRDSLAFSGGIIVSILTNFLLHHSWTWADRTARDDRQSYLGRLAKFYLVSALAAGVQWTTSSLVSPLLRRYHSFSRILVGEFRLYHVLAPCAGILLALSVNFLANHWWTFREKAPED